MIKVGVCALQTHERRKHWCRVHSYLPIILVMWGVSKRAVAEAMGGSFDGDSYTTRCLKSTHFSSIFSTQIYNYTVHTLFVEESIKNL